MNALEFIQFIGVTLPTILERNLTKVTSIYWVMENGKLPLEGGVEYSNYKVSVKAEEILLARNFNPEVYNYVFGELLQATEDS